MTHTNACKNPYLKKKLDGNYNVNSLMLRESVIAHCYGFSIPELQYGTNTQKRLYFALRRRSNEVKDLFDEGYLFRERDKKELRKLTDLELGVLVFDNYLGQHHSEIQVRDNMLYHELTRRNLIKLMVKEEILKNGKLHGNPKIRGKPHQKFSGYRVGITSPLDTQYVSTNGRTRVGLTGEMRT